MHDCRLYAYDKDGRLIGPPLATPVEDDEAAVARAKVRLDDLAADLMDGERLVKRIRTKE